MAVGIEKIFAFLRLLESARNILVWIGLLEKSCGGGRSS